MSKSTRPDPIARPRVATSEAWLIPKPPRGGAAPLTAQKRGPDTDAAPTEPYSYLKQEEISDSSAVTERASAPVAARMLGGDDDEVQTIKLAESGGFVWEETGDIGAYRAAVAAADAAAKRPEPNGWQSAAAVVQILIAGAFMTAGFAAILLLTRGAGG